jgi:hypothetical protein
MSYALQDCESEVEKALPSEVTEEFMRDELGLEPTEDNKLLAETIFKKLRTRLTSRYKVMGKSLFHEKQQYHICQQKNMDYLKLYSGNALLSEDSTKRMAYWDKVQNTKDNKEKQTANQNKSAKNAASADFRKNKGNGNQQNGNNSNFSKGGGGGGGGNTSGGNRPWVPPWANQSSDNSSGNNYQGNSSNYQGNNFSKPFTPKNCPKCLKKHHGNSPCE